MTHGGVKATDPPPTVTPIAGNQQVGWSDEESEKAKQAMADAARSGSRPWLQAKLLVVGEGRAGKTSLIRALAEEDFRPDEESTALLETNCCTVERQALQDWHKKPALGGDFARAVAQQMVDVQSAVAAASEQKKRDHSTLLGKLNSMVSGKDLVAEAAKLPPIESVAEQAAPLLPLSMEEIHVGRILGDGADGPVESKCHTPTAELSESGGGSTEEAAAALSVAAQAAEKVAEEVAAEAEGAGTEEAAEAAPEAAPEAAEAAAAADVGVSKMDVDLLLKYQRDGVEESVTLITYDYGGQRVFYALHHLFLTRFGVYLCCFDMRKMVDTGATEAVVVDGKKTGERRPIYDPAGCLSFLRFWLASIYEHARDAQGQSATVLLIGTHGDHVKTAEQHKAVSDQLLDTFGIENAANGDGMLIRSLEFSDDELCFWPLDNTQVNARSGDISVPRLSSVGPAADCTATPYPLLSLPPPAQRRPTC